MSQMKPPKYQQPVFIKSVSDNMSSEVHSWTVPPHTHQPWALPLLTHPHSNPCISIPTHPLNLNHTYIHPPSGHHSLHCIPIDPLEPITPYPPILWTSITPYLPTSWILTSLTCPPLGP